MNHECPTCRDTGYKQLEPHARLYCKCWRGDRNRHNDMHGDHYPECRACKDTGYYKAAPNVFKLCDCRAGQLRRGKTTTAPPEPAVFQPRCLPCKDTGWKLITPSKYDYCHCIEGIRIRQADHKEISASVPAPTAPPHHELTEAEEAALDTAWARAMGPGWTVKS